ncbi:DedA family protein [Pseudomonas monteilii]|jgi:membrane protein DedA with SNARE-associated domain|uniref:DedA family protein n=1 Tax=Pseudomonas alabamensis TaxID=3064349 RepID=UPI003F650270
MSPVESFAVDHPLLLLALNVFGDQMGLPIPSYPSLVLAGAFASQHGAPDPVLVVLMALVVCLLADCIWYLMGARFGDALTRRICRSSPKMSAAFAQGRKAYLRHGPMVLIFAKFVPGAGAVSTLLAGQLGMPKAHFVAYSLLSSLLWCNSALALGAGFGGPIVYAFDSMKDYLVLGLASVGVGALGLLAFKVARTALKQAIRRPIIK